MTDILLKSYMKTTLNKIRAKSPCEDGWKKLLTHLGKTKADDEPLAITTILDSNGLDTALWCLRTVEGHDREIRLYAVWCARQVQHLMADKRSLNALDVAEKFANGQATEKELHAALFAEAARAVAGDAARAAAGDAAKAAWDAADAAEAEWAATWAAEAMWAAARAAVWAAARDATWAAAEDAGDAARDAQEKQLRKICAGGVAP